MALFTILSALGVFAFFKAGDWPVGVLLIGLTAVYVCEFFASLGMREVADASGNRPEVQREIGSFRARVS